MDFSDQIKQFSKRIEALRDTIQTEEATKTSVIMPFFNMLGYDVFNPAEFVPEFTADVGIKKGEKVDYAIIQDGVPTILIEAKWIGDTLEKHDSQLFRYFGTTAAKFAILTNGIVYKFYTDLDESNKMDSTPFLEIDLLNYNDNQINELKKFCKENFDLGKIFDTASELKYMGLIQKAFKSEFLNPSDEFVRFILSDGVYEGVKTQNIIEKYKPLVKKALFEYINEMVNEKIQSALKSSEDEVKPVVVEEAQEEQQPESAGKDRIVTTEEELQAFYIIKSLMGEMIDLDRITYKDTASYFSVLLDGKVTKWICRLYLGQKNSSMVLVQNGENMKIPLDSINDIYKHADILRAKVQELLELMESAKKISLQKRRGEQSEDV